MSVSVVLAGASAMVLFTSPDLAMSISPSSSAALFFELGLLEVAELDEVGFSAGAVRPC